MRKLEEVQAFPNEVAAMDKQRIRYGIAQMGADLMRRAILEPGLDPTSFLRLKVQYSNGSMTEFMQNVTKVRMTLLVAESENDMEFYFDGGPLDGQVRSLPPGSQSHWYRIAGEPKLTVVDVDVPYHVHTYERVGAHEYKYKELGR